MLGQVAKAKGRSIENVLDMIWPDMPEGLISQVARNEALKLEAYALTTGRMGILETTGDSLTELTVVEELRRTAV
ncbi:hypothetical protein GCM10010517_75230 [Streptosporangium fragile]|uniref:Uncharacterized protein n=1 Tax=Streptosporangium fragile TaxID=46186 RepID=A0ABN3WA58_9ACTN